MLDVALAEGIAGEDSSWDVCLFSFVSSRIFQLYIVHCDIVDKVDYLFSAKIECNCYEPDDHTGLLQRSSWNQM